MSRLTRSVATAAVLLLVGCSGDNPPADPYERYLQIAPEDAPDLTRSDALVRAAFGCGASWDAPLPYGISHPFGGELDAALLSAYGCDGLHHRQAFTFTIVEQEHPILVTPGWDDMMAPLNGPLR